MYGYEIPRYAREYLAEWRRYDRFLRLRWSLDYPGMYILERKTRWLSDHDFARGTDAQVQFKDGYRKVFLVAPCDIRFVSPSLQKFDIQKHGGAKALADELDRQDDKEHELIDRARVAEFESIASEHYDRIAWEEKRRVAVPNKVEA
jgi:hypothetical protein